VVTAFAGGAYTLYFTYVASSVRTVVGELTELVQPDPPFQIHTKKKYSNHPMESLVTTITVTKVGQTIHLLLFLINDMMLCRTGRAKVTTDHMAVQYGGLVGASEVANASQSVCCGLLGAIFYLFFSVPVVPAFHL
jgi:hypothetical protein